MSGEMKYVWMERSHPVLELFLMRAIKAVNVDGTSKREKRALDLANLVCNPKRLLLFRLGTNDKQNPKGPRRGLGLSGFSTEEPKDTVSQRQAIFACEFPGKIAEFLRINVQNHTRRESCIELDPPIAHRPRWEEPLIQRIRDLLEFGTIAVAARGIPDPLSNPLRSPRCRCQRGLRKMSLGPSAVVFDQRDRIR